MLRWIITCLVSSAKNCIWKEYFERNEYFSVYFVCQSLWLYNSRVYSRFPIDVIFLKSVDEEWISFSLGLAIQMLELLFSISITAEIFFFLIPMIEKMSYSRNEKIWLKHCHGSEKIFKILCWLGLVLDNKPTGTHLTWILRQGRKLTEEILVTQSRLRERLWEGGSDCLSCFRSYYETNGHFQTQLACHQHVV